MFNNIAFLVLFIFSFSATAQTYNTLLTPPLSSPRGDEYAVSFRAQYLVEDSSVENIRLWSDTQKSSYIKFKIEPTLKYLFGPLTNRDLGGIKEIKSIEVDWANASERNGQVILPYTYKGIWLLAERYSLIGQITVPVPYNESLLYTDSWKNCTDRSPEHQTRSFYWYFWDPTRFLCDQTADIQYENVLVSLDLKSKETTLSYPEYNKMIILDENGQRKMKMTVAFGYVYDQQNPAPETDRDPGAEQYRYFIYSLRSIIPLDAQDTPIHYLEYMSWGLDRIVGHKYTYTKDNVNYEIKVVINAGIDQMYLFAKSFAADHDSYFAWLGHSRVGSGFDAERFTSIVASSPEIYSISTQYQLIYWGGCNSYSYYTIPFFNLKAEASQGADPNGTKTLDIIANTMPSFFSLNSNNALLQVNALLNWQTPTSYQEILLKTEAYAARQGTEVLAVVLGDEDNE